MINCGFIKLSKDFSFLSAASMVEVVVVVCVRRWAERGRDKGRSRKNVNLYPLPCVFHFPTEYQGPDNGI
jgi:hypothetical protein